MTDVSTTLTSASALTARSTLADAVADGGAGFVEAAALHRVRDSCRVVYWPPGPPAQRALEPTLEASLVLVLAGESPQARVARSGMGRKSFARDDVTVTGIDAPA